MCIVLVAAVVACLDATVGACLDETLAQAVGPRQRSGPQAHEIERLDALPGAGRFSRIASKQALGALQFDPSCCLVSPLIKIWQNS